MKRRRMPVRKVVGTPRPEEVRRNRDHEKPKGKKWQALPDRRVCVNCGAGFGFFLDATLCMQCEAEADKVHEAARAIADASNGRPL